MCLIAFQTRAAKGFVVLSIFFFLLILPFERLAARETNLVRLGLYLSRDFTELLFQHPRSAVDGISAREQLRRRGSF